MSGIFDKMAISKVDPFVGLMVRSVIIGVAVISMGLVTGRLGEICKIPWKTILLFCCSAIPAGLLGQLFYYSALKADQASRIVPITSTYPVIALLLGAVILKEPITIRKATGILTVVVGIWLIKEGGRPGSNAVSRAPLSSPSALGSETGH